MPELPEVETIKRRLRHILVDKKINRVQVFREKSFQGVEKKIVGLKIVEISRRAKLLRIQLEAGLNLLIHLKMTGQLIYTDDKLKIGGGHPSADWVNSLPSPYTRVEISFTDGSKLFFNDMRVFGWIRALSDQEVLDEYAKYGPDANSSDFSVEYLSDKIKKRSVSIKQTIMMNEIVAGIGNIYAVEALFLARIDPRRSASSLSQEEVKRLVDQIKHVIEEGIKHKGTTFDGKFVDVSGLSGKHQNYLYIYGREGRDCLICGKKLKKVNIGGRGSCYCENCQH